MTNSLVADSGFCPGSYSAKVVGDPTYGLSALLQCSMSLRTMGDSATTMEQAARRCVRFLRDHFVDKDTGESALPLVRIYVTQQADQLEPHVRDFAVAAGSDSRIGPDVVCLTLLASAGEQEAWNDRNRSIGHQAIPLPSVQAISRLPMVSQLFQQMGVDVRSVIGRGAALVDDERRPCGIFHVAEALDHPAIPAQNDFVIPYAIRSAVGFGGILPAGEVFAVVAFSRVGIPERTVDAFVAAALATKLALSPFSGGSIFDAHHGEPVRADLALVRAESRGDTLDQLLAVRFDMVMREAGRLETELSQAEERAVELAMSKDALTQSEARKTAIVEGALDCVIGMDADGRIVDFNRAAEQTFGHRREDILGDLLGERLVPPSMRERHRLGLARHREHGEGPILGRRIEVNALHRDGHEFPVELTVTPIMTSGPMRYTGYVRDLTAQKEAQFQLARSHERLAHIARTLQASLLPPALPVIPGYQLAATYRAMGEGFEVGGDFYDVFEVKDDRWALTLGDVCGKGSDAAAITGLARHTIRAAAMSHDDPLGVLRAVHEAIRRNGSTRFCTAVYAELDPVSGSMRIVLGGHPQPFMLRTDGAVERVGEHGHLLGSFPEWSGRTTGAQLAPGELVLLFSDGVTEARRGDEQFGDDRLEAVLRSTVGASADQAVAMIESAVLDFAGELNDDVAILALRRSASD